MSQPTGSLEILIAVITTLNTNIERLTDVLLNPVAGGAPVETAEKETKPEVDEKAEKAKADKAAKAKADKEAKEAKAKADKEAKAEKAAAEKSKVTKSEMVEGLRKVRADVDKDEAVRIIKEIGGVEKMAQIPEDKYEAVFTACEAALNGETETEEEDM